MKTFIVQKALVINEDHNVLVLKRSLDDAVRPGLWDFPGGSYAEGEDLLTTVVRETHEETSLTITNQQLVYAVSEPKIVENIVSLFYLAKAEPSEVVLSEEHTEFRWVSLQEAISLFIYPKQLGFLTYVSEHGLFEDYLVR